MSEEKELTIQDIIKWCDEQVEQGHELKLCWEGGGDSGWCWFEVDGEQCSQPEAEWLINEMYEVLDYGSWAGEYSANGEAIYDSETKQFEGTDFFSTEETYAYSCKNPFIIKIPKSIYFDSLHLECEGESYEFNVNASVTNGFFLKEAEEFFSNLEKEITAWSETVISEIVDSEISKDNELTAAYESYDLDKSDFTEEDDCFVYTLEQYYYRTYDVEEKGININLIELLEDETLD